MNEIKEIDFVKFFDILCQGNKYKIQFKRKEDFCKELLCCSVNNRDIVIYIDEETSKKSEKGQGTFHSYYRKSENRFSKALASKIVSKQYKDEDKLKSFLSNYIENCCSKTELVQHFSDYIKDLNKNNLVELLSALFYEIIENISKTTDKRTTRNKRAKTVKEESSNIKETSSTNIKTEQVIVEETNVKTTYYPQGGYDIDSLMTELKETIYNLQDIGHKIASRVSNMKSDTDFKLIKWALPSELHSAIQKDLSKGIPLYSELESGYNKLQELYDSIDLYNIEHKEDILNKVLELISRIKIDTFIEKWREATIKSKNNQYIIELNEIIQNYFKDKDE